MVVERIQASDFFHKDEVLHWYETCQKEAERCGSFSEEDAARYCNRCHSKMSEDGELEMEDDDDDDDDDGDKHPPSSQGQGELIVPAAGHRLLSPEEPLTSVEPDVDSQARTGTPTNTPSSSLEGSYTETTTATTAAATATTATVVEPFDPAKTLPQQDSPRDQQTQGTASAAASGASKAKAAAIAAANVEDPPDRIDPKATNLQGSSLNQVKPMAATTGCGSKSCVVM
jgi:hypothetical protein